jgi:hypothetical protein
MIPYDIGWTDRDQAEIAARGEALVAQLHGAQRGFRQLQ